MKDCLGTIQRISNQARAEDMSDYLLQKHFGYRGSSQANEDDVEDGEC